MERVKMADSELAYQSKADPKRIVRARQKKTIGPDTAIYEPDLTGPVDESEWIVGVIDPTGEFRATNAPPATLETD
jgi:hypothetical protein